MEFRCFNCKHQWGSVIYDPSVVVQICFSCKNKVTGAFFQNKQTRTPEQVIFICSKQKEIYIAKHSDNPKKPTSTLLIQIIWMKNAADSAEAMAKSYPEVKVMFVIQSIQWRFCDSTIALFFFNGFLQEPHQRREPEPYRREVSYIVGRYRCFGCGRNWTSRRIYRHGGLREARAECFKCQFHLLPIMLVMKSE